LKNWAASPLDRGFLITIVFFAGAGVIKPSICSKVYFLPPPPNFVVCFISPGVDVMNTILCDFRQFSAKKLALFSKINVMITILNNLAFLSQKTHIFSLNFSAKIFLNS
jgi:hypothetical protein